MDFKTKASFVNWLINSFVNSKVNSCYIIAEIGCYIPNMDYYHQLLSGTFIYTDSCLYNKAVIICKVSIVLLSTVLLASVSGLLER